MMQNTVECCGGYRIISYKFCPLAKGPVGSEDHRTDFITNIHYLEEYMGLLRIDILISDLIEQQEVRFAEPSQFPFEPVWPSTTAPQHPYS